MGGQMSKKNTGILLLIDRYRRFFRIPENLDHYSEEDYKTAEKKFVKFALNEGWAGA